MCHGDGTVPVWSALPRSGQKQLVVGEHASFFTQATFKAVFYRLLGGRYTQEPFSVAGDTLRLSVPDIVIPADRPIELLLIPDAPESRIEGRIVMERSATGQGDWVEHRAAVQVRYDGAPVTQLRVMLEPAGAAGIYRIGFAGSPGSAEPVLFAASVVAEPGDGG